MFCYEAGHPFPESPLECIGGRQIPGPVFRDHIRDALSDLLPQGDNAMAREHMYMDDIDLSVSFPDLPDAFFMALNKSAGVDQNIQWLDSCGCPFIVYPDGMQRLISVIGKHINRFFLMLVGMHIQY
jgi:hypothetical protein